MSSDALPLAAYRDLIELDRPVDHPGAPLDADLTSVTAALIDEADQREASWLADDDQSRLLRQLLTMRPPGPLPGLVGAALDRLLAAQARSRHTVSAQGLARIADSLLTPYPAGSQTAIWQGDITTLSVDAIVNAANDRLVGCFIPFHRCIDNAIHNAAGPQLREDCAAIRAAQNGFEPTGFAKVTRGYHLPARSVLHTVGPIVDGATPTNADARALRRSYLSCLDLAAELGSIRSVAICAISTGVFGFPREAAAKIALGSVADWFEANPGQLDLVVFNVFSDEDRAIYEASLAAS